MSALWNNELNHCVWSVASIIKKKTVHKDQTQQQQKESGYFASSNVPKSHKTILELCPVEGRMQGRKPRHGPFMNFM